MKKKIIVFIIFFIFINLFVLYIVNFPLQKIKAEKAFENYLKEQEISESSILYKDIMKNIKLNRYTFFVQFEDDPQILYHYMYPVNGDLPHKILVLGYWLENEQKIERPYGGRSVESNMLKHKPLK